MDTELEWLYNRKSEIENEMSHFFDGIDNPNEGDRVYQQLWEELNNVEEQIKEINEKE